jgi:hypothetical protein
MRRDANRSLDRFVRVASRRVFRRRRPRSTRRRSRSPLRARRSSRRARSRPVASFDVAPAGDASFDVACAAVARAREDARGGRRISGHDRAYEYECGSIVSPK